MYKTIFFNAGELTDELVALGVAPGWAEPYSDTLRNDFPILISSEIKVTVFLDAFGFGLPNYKIDLRYTSV